MAAVQWSGGKCKSIQQAKAWFRHNDIESRKEMHHTNPHINKAMTKYNFSYKNLDYEGLCAAFDKRLGEVDAGRQSSGKNARVLLQSVAVYLPAGLRTASREVKTRWFRRAGDILQQRFGDNFLDMQVDFDENHNYYDPEKKEWVISSEHGHGRLFPEVNGKLNAKAFSSREAINGLNNDLHKMTLEEFGCVYMDGSKAKGGKTVEQLKAKSEAAAIIATAEASAEAIRQAAEVKAGEILSAAEKDRQRASDALKSMKQDIYDRGFAEWMAGHIVDNRGRTAEDFLNIWERKYKKEQQEKLGLEQPKRRKTGGKHQKQEQLQPVPEKISEPEKQPLQLDPMAQERINATLVELGYQNPDEEANGMSNFEKI